MPISYLPDAAARIKSTAKEAVASLKTPIEAVDYPQVVGDPPFLALRLGGFQSFELTHPYSSEEWVNDLRTFTLYIVMATLKSGYKGETVNKIYQYEELLIQHFKSVYGRNLKSAAYPNRPTYLVTADGVDFSSGTGLIAIEMGGVGELMLASSYTITVPCAAQLF